MPILYSHLSIRSLELNVNLGWRHKERRQEQAVLLDVAIDFAKPPKASKTDQLEDTICYATLIEDVHNHLSEKKYKLIEHLSYDIYHIIKMRLPPKSNVTVRITKYPKIKGSIGGVCFYYGDKAW
jgi:dihydroneopterin aldolase